MPRLSSDKEDLRISLFTYIRGKGLQFFVAAKLQEGQSFPTNTYIYLEIHVITQIWSATQSVLKTSTVERHLKYLNLTGHLKESFKTSQVLLV